jgi:hypothetical protein
MLFMAGTILWNLVLGQKFEIMPATMPSGNSIFLAVLAVEVPPGILFHHCAINLGVNGPWLRRGQGRRLFIK